MFQHYIQKAYLERWRTGGKLYLFSKSENRWKKATNSARRILGLEDMQSDAMETAFADVENCIGNTDNGKVIGSDEKVNTLATWIALHGLRNARNIPLLKTNYKKTVAELAYYLRNHYAFFLEKSDDALITCDNPITRLAYSDAGQQKELFFAPISPRRALVIIQDDKIPDVSAENWNELTFRNATDICVSWERHLHFDQAAKPFAKWPLVLGSE